MDKMDLSARAFFLFFGLFLWLGIALTGFEQAHWILYLPASFFVFAAIVGICPGMVFFREFFRAVGGQKLPGSDK